PFQMQNRNIFYYRCHSSPTHLDLPYHILKFPPSQIVCKSDSQHPYISYRRYPFQPRVLQKGNTMGGNALLYLYHIVPVQNETRFVSSPRKKRFHPRTILLPDEKNSVLEQISLHFYKHVPA